MELTNIQIGMAVIVLLLLFFAPTTCNGVTYWTGIRGCSS